MHGQRVAFPAEPVGVHDEQPERRAFAARRVLDGGLDQPVAEHEVVGAREARAHVGMPEPGVVVVHVFRDVYHRFRASA